MVWCVNTGLIVCNAVVWYSADCLSFSLPTAATI